MQTIVFLIDNSASMNQRCYMGTTLLDVAKSAVETFVKQRSNRTDKYMLVTLDEGNTAIKSGWKDCQNHTFTLNRLKNITADGITTLGHALKLSFDLLSINRHLSCIDTYGHGRSPFYLEPSIIIAITDGGKLSNRSSVFDDLHLPMSNLLPGSELTKEPFRWDQRLFSLVLRLPATATYEPEQLGSVPTDRSPISLMCEVTGGRSYCIKTQKTLLQCLDSLVQKVQSGVVVHFEKSDRSKDDVTLKTSGSEESKANPNEPLSWHSLHRMIYVRPSPKSGMPIGHWPLPESYFPDQNAPTLPPRSAHPVLKFICDNVEPLLLPNFPYDKYELEPSPLTQILLEQKNAHICWQVYVENSGKQTNLFHPCGYLKASSSLTSVNLFVMPYNYPVLLPLIDQLIKQKMKPAPDWRRQFEDYLKTVPHYYVTPLRKSLKQIGAHALIPEAFGTGLSYSVNIYLKKLKEQTKTTAERFNTTSADVNSNRKGVLLKPRTNSFSVAAHYNFQKLLSDIGDSRSPYKRVEVDEFAGFRIGEHTRQKFLTRDFHNPFDIPRDRLLQQVHNMAVNFRQVVQSSNNGNNGGGLEQLANTMRIRLQDRAGIHNQPIAQMGNYQDYVKNLAVPLREANPDVPRRQHTFGNPFKLAKEKGIMIDETEDYDGPSASGPTGKRKTQGDHSGPPSKRKRPSSPHPRIRGDFHRSLKDKKPPAEDQKPSVKLAPILEEKVENPAFQTPTEYDSGFTDSSPVHSSSESEISDVGFERSLDKADKNPEQISSSQEWTTTDSELPSEAKLLDSKRRQIVKLIRRPGLQTDEIRKLLKDVKATKDAKGAFAEQLINEAARFKRKMILSLLQDFAKKL